MLTLLPGVHENENIISRDTDNKEDSDDVKEPKVSNLKNTSSYDAGCWET